MMEKTEYLRCWRPFERSCHLQRPWNNNPAASQSNIIVTFLFFFYFSYNSIIYYILLYEKSNNRAWFSTHVQSATHSGGVTHNEILPPSILIQAQIWVCHGKIIIKGVRFLSFRFLTVRIRWVIWKFIYRSRDVGVCPPPTQSPPFFREEVQLSSSLDSQFLISDYFNYIRGQFVHLSSVGLPFLGFPSTPKPFGVFSLQYLKLRTSHTSVKFEKWNYVLIFLSFFFLKKQ